MKISHSVAAIVGRAALLGGPQPYNSSNATLGTSDSCV